MLHKSFGHVIDQLHELYIVPVKQAFILACLCYFFNFGNNFPIIDDTNRLVIQIYLTVVSTIPNYKNFSTV